MGHELKLRGVSDGTFLAGVLVNEYCANDNVVSSIHGDYLATCDIITTNSFVAVSYCDILQVKIPASPPVSLPVSLIVGGYVDNLTGSTEDD